MNFVFATFKNTHIIEIHTVWALIVSAHCTHMVISHQLNKQRATVKALCITWSALLHHQHDYQLHTSVSPQDQRAGNGRDIFISMHQSHCTLSLSWLFPVFLQIQGYSFPLPNTTRFKSSSFWTSLIVSLLDLPDTTEMLYLPSLSPSCTPSGPTWPWAMCWAACLVVITLTVPEGKPC